MVGEKYFKGGEGKDISTTEQGKYKVFITQDGDTSIFEVNPLIIRDGENELLPVVFCENKTREEILAGKFEALKKLSLAGELAAGAVHEIRNPLSVIKGFIQLLKEEPNKGDKNKEYYNVILKELDRLNDLIGGFLTIAKPCEVKFTKGCINDVIKDMVCLIEPKAILYDAIIETDLSEDVPDIEMNIEHIKQVFLNLLNNALEAVCNGKDRKVEVNSSVNKENIIIRIKDTGAGILAEEMDGIFEPFYTTKKEGTGLGLAVCKKIVENHDGTISLNSKKGKGSTFTIFLPIVQEQ